MSLSVCMCVSVLGVSMWRVGCGCRVEQECKSWELSEGLEGRLIPVKRMKKKTEKKKAKVPES